MAALVRDGGQPISARVEAIRRRQAASQTLDNLLDMFLARHVQPNLRSADEIERCFRVYVRPRLGNRSIYDLRRRHIVELLDSVEDNNGAVMADRVLAHLRKAFRWQAARDDEFTPPIVPGMARTKPKERARDRTLDDQELLDVDEALDELGQDAPACYPAYVRTLLLTAQRRSDVAQMTWAEINGTTWIIPAARYKTKMAVIIPLPTRVVALLGERRTGFVFSSDGGKRPFSGFSKANAPSTKRSQCCGSVLDASRCRTGGCMICGAPRAA
jgi:integrase